MAAPLPTEPQPQPGQPGQPQPQPQPPQEGLQTVAQLGKQSDGGLEQGMQLQQSMPMVAPAAVVEEGTQAAR